MAVKEPGWILETPGKRKVEREDDNRKRVLKTQNRCKQLIFY